MGWRSAHLASVLALALLAGCAQPVSAPTTRFDFYGDPLPEGAVQRLGTTRLDNRTRGVSACFLPDASRVVAGGLGIWDLSTGLLLKQLDLPGSYGGFTVSKDGKMIAAVAKDRSIRFVDVESGAVLGGTGPRTVRSVIGQRLQFSPDGKLLASARYNKTPITLWSVPEGRRVSSFSRGSNMRFFADGRRMLIVDGTGDSSSNVLKVWDMAAGRQVYEIPVTREDKAQGRAGELRSVRFDLAQITPDQKYIVAAAFVLFTRDKDTGKGRYYYRIDIYEAQGGRLTGSFKTDDAYFQAIAISEDCTAIAIGRWRSDKRESGFRPQVIRFDPADPSRRKVVDIQGSLPHNAGGFFLSRKGDKLGFVFGGFRFWETSTGRPFLERYRPWYVVFARFISNGRQVVTVAHDGTVPVYSDGRVALYDADSGRCLALGESRQLRRDDDWCGCHLSHDERRLLTFNRNAMTLWQLPGLKPRVLPRDWHFQRGAFLGDGRTILLVSRYPRAGRVWPQVLDVAGGGLTPLPHPAPETIKHYCGIWPENHIIGAANEKDSSVDSFLLDMDTSQVISVLAGVRSFEAARGRISRLGDLIVLVRVNDFVRIVDLFSGQDLTRLSCKPRVSAMAISTDGGLLAVSTWKKVTLLYDLTDGKLLARFNAAANYLDFSPDRKRLLCAGKDTLIWDISRFSGRRQGFSRSTSLEELWRNLGSDDAKVARAAMLSLAARGATAASFIHKKLQAEQAGLRKQLAEYLQQLEADDWKARDAAQKKLRSLGKEVHLFLRAQLDDVALPPETRVRIKAVIGSPSLPRLEQPPLEVAKLLRALFVLEGVRTPQAKEGLRQLTGPYPAPVPARAKRALGNR